MHLTVEIIKNYQNLIYKKLLYHQPMENSVKTSELKTDH